MRRTLWGLTGLLLLLLLTGCGSRGPVGTEDGPFTVYDCGDVKAAVYTRSLEDLELRQPDDPEVLLELWEPRSRTEAERDGLEEPRGLVLRLLRLEGDRADQRIGPGVWGVARDGETYYALEADPEHQLYRSGGVEQADYDLWDRLMKTAVLLGADLPLRNPELTALVRGGTAEEERTLPDLPRLLKRLEDGDLLISVYPYWTQQKMDELAQVLTLAASCVTDRTDLAWAPLLGERPTWSLEAAWGRNRTLQLGCWEGEAPLVSVACQSDGLTTAVCLEDQSLYDLVRHSRDGVRRVDLLAAERHRDILDHAQMDLLAAYSEDPAEFTDCLLTQFTEAFTYEETLRSRVTVYDVEFALVPAHPERLELTGDMYLDGDLHVRGISDLGQLAVRYRDSTPTAEAFLGMENYFPYWEDPTERWDLASWVLNQAELGAINPVRVLEEALVDPEVLEDCIPLEDDPAGETLVLYPRYEVSDFRFFTVAPRRQEGEILLEEQVELWSAPALSPDRPLAVTMVLEPGLPARGFSFRVGDDLFSYGIVRSSRDGAILLMDMT